MKLKLGIFLFFLSLLVLSKSISAANPNIYHDLNEILKVTSQNQVEVKEWRVYYRTIDENVKPTDLQKMISSIKSNKSYTWSEEGEENHHKTIMGIKRSNQGETMMTISYIKNSKVYYVTQSYQIISNKRVNRKSSELLNIPNGFKKENPYITISGITKDKQDLTLLSTHLMGSLSAHYVEGIKEKDFTSISGLTKNLGHELQTDRGKAFNVQIGLRTSEDKRINVTIGSPIITTEY